MKTLFLIFICFFSSLSLSGKTINKPAYFRYYFDKLNLPQTTILQIEQDAKGYLWLATGHGVYRFDGNQAVSLAEIVPGNDEILKQFTSWIMVDNNAGLLWMSTGYVFEFKSGLLRKNEISSEKMQNAPLVDVQGNLWLSFHDRYVKYNKGYNDCSVLETSVGIGFTKSEHYVWGVSSSNFIYRMTVGEGNISSVQYNLNIWGIHNVTKLCAVNDELLLIGTKYSGAWLFDVVNQEARKIFHENYVRDIMPYSASVYWIATENGIYIYDIISDTTEHWTKDPYNMFSLKDHAIYSVYKDREGGIWCGSYFRGLSYVPNGLCHFNSFKPCSLYPDLKGTVYREFCQDRDGNLWIGTEDGGLNCYTKKDDRFVNYSKINGLGSNNIHGLFMDGDELWCGSFDNGIEIFDIRKRKVVRSYKAGDGVSKLVSDFVFSIIRKRDGKIWIGTDRGIQQFDDASGSFENVYPDITICKSLFQDSNGTVWCASNDTLYSITEDGKLGEYYFCSKSVQSVMETTDNEIWSATSEGIAHYDKAKNDFVFYSLSDLSDPTNYAYSIVEDGQGFFWISTAHGLVRFNPSTGSSYVFTTLEGLPENRFNVSSSFIDDEGLVYLGTIDGFTSFDPTLLLPSKIVPRLGLTKMTCSGVNNERVIYNLTDSVFNIDYTENNIKFELSSFTYTAPDALRYRYRLDPLDKSWHVQQGYAPVTYLSLPSGKYKLRFQITDYNGIWVPDEVCYTINIIPPFYASWYAKLFYVIFICAFVMFVLKLWHKRMKEKQLIHIQEVKDATEKEIYHTKINFFTTIVHEIRTPLTLIKAPLDKELEKNRSENLLLVEKNVDRLQNLCTQLLDFRKMESDQLQLNFVKTNLPDMLKGILYRFSAQILDNGMVCEDNLDSIDLEAPVDREAFTKIVSNLLNNAVKYGSKYIKVELTSDKDNLYFSVYNDGERITESDRSKIFNMFYRTDSVGNATGNGIGLSFCRSLAEMHNGKLELVDDNDYTHFRLTLPLKQEVVFSIESLSDEFTEDEVGNVDIPVNGEVTILVVEDEPELRAFLKDSLSETYRVLTASNGAQAMDIIEKTSVSLVVTDIMMPKMDGCELCRAIKNRIDFCGIPVVMLTSKNTVESRLDGYMAGAEEYIEKPFSMKYLSARIAIILEKKKKEAETHYNSQTTINIDRLVDNSDRVLIEKFRSIVEENLTNDKLDIPFLCEKLGMSQSTFFRKLKSVLNVSPNDYIRIARLEHAAKILLENDKMRIRDVAYELGFSTPSYFTRCFIQHYGMTPKEYMLSKKEEV